MKNLQFLMISVVALILMISVLQTDSSKKHSRRPSSSGSWSSGSGSGSDSRPGGKHNDERSCEPDSKHGHKCRIGCDNCEGEDCKFNPNHEFTDDACLPLVKQTCPLNGEINLCNITLVAKLLKGIKLKDLCIDICWDTMKCPGKPTKIVVSLVKHCKICVRAKNLGTAINCCTITACRMIKKMGLGEILPPKGDKSGKSQALLR